MKSVIIYYSLTGNTCLVAKMIAERLGSDLIRLKPEKEIPSDKSSKYLLGSKSVLLDEKPKLMNENINLEGYDTVIVGSPVWARSLASPVNTFLSDYGIKDKSIYLFTTHSAGATSDRCFSKMKEKLSRNIVKGTAEFEDVKKMSAKELDDKVRKFCKTMID